MKDTFDPYPIQGHYLFQSDHSDPIRAFEEATQFKLNRKDFQTFQIEQFDERPKQQEKSWWNSFWEDGWSHVAFGTVSTAVGVGTLCVLTGPIGWVSGVLALSGALAVAGGSVGVIAGGGQLLSSDPGTKLLFSQVGDASLSLNNIPGLAAGTATYVFTGNFDQSVEYANYAGLLAGGASLAKSGFNAYKLQRLYNFEVGSHLTKWSRRTRSINAMVMDINPKGLEGSHLIPQRVIGSLVKSAPELQRPIENLLNGPLGVTFMPKMSHALVDSKRFQFLTPVEKEILSAAYPLRTDLIKNYPKLADALGFYQNMSPTAKPMFNSLIITGGRVAKVEATSSSKK